MFWFVLRFAIWSLLLFGLISFKDYSPLYFINTLQTDATVFMTNLWIQNVNIPVRMEGDLMVFEHGLRLLFVDSCNGLPPCLLYLAAILAYPTRYTDKTKWFIGGIVVLLSLNMVRIMLITLLVIVYPESFEWAHNIFGRYTIGAITLYLFYFFTTHVSTCTPYGIILNGKNCHAEPSLRT